MMKKKQNLLKTGALILIAALTFTTCSKDSLYPADPSFQQTFGANFIVIKAEATKSLLDQWE